MKIYLIEKIHLNERGKAGSTVFIEKAYGLYVLSLLGLIGSFLIDTPFIDIIRLNILCFFCFLTFVIVFLRSSALTIWFSVIGTKVNNSIIKRINNYLEKFSLALTRFPLKKSFFYQYV